MSCGGLKYDKAESNNPHRYSNLFFTTGDLCNLDWAIITQDYKIK
jgi:hypothetical protein